MLSKAYRELMILGFLSITLVLLLVRAVPRSATATVPVRYSYNRAVGWALGGPRESRARGSAHIAAPPRTPPRARREAGGVQGALLQADATAEQRPYSVLVV